MATKTATAKTGTKAADRAHAKSYRSPYGRWYLGGVLADTTVTVDSDDLAAVAPLRAVAAEQGQALRVAQGSLAPRTSRVAPAARAATRERAQAFVAANAQPKAPAAVTVTTSESKRARYARLDAMANALPVGRYALPRREDAGNGQSVYFFEVQRFRAGHRIVMLTGGVGSFAQHPMSTTYQEVALTKIAADPKVAAVRFGHETSTCARCGSPLTNDASRARGLGPKCVKAY